MTEKPMGSTTRDQVALRAGVSSATVSRVYNHPALVSQDKREAVLRASRELGYFPNKTASSLRRKGTGTITLVECIKPPRDYYWGDLRTFSWFYADVIHGVQEMIHHTMYTLQLKRVHDLSEFKELAGSTDGIICFDVDRLEEAEAAASLGIPYVISHHTDSFSGHPRCSTDNRAGGFLQAAYLAESGCSSAWYLTAHLDTVTSHKDRLEGFLEGALEHNLQVTVESGLEDSKAREACARRIASQAPAGCGAAAVNDLTLIRMLYACREIGFAAAGMTAVGYDAMPVRDLLPVSFASIDLRPSAVYCRAAEMLMQMVLQGYGSRQRSETVEPVVMLSPPGIQEQ